MTGYNKNKTTRPELYLEFQTSQLNDLIARAMRRRSLCIEMIVLTLLYPSQRWLYFHTGTIRIRYCKISLYYTRTWLAACTELTYSKTIYNRIRKLPLWRKRCTSSPLHRIRKLSCRAALQLAILAYYWWKRMTMNSRCHSKH